MLKTLLKKEFSKDSSHSTPNTKTSDGFTLDWGKKTKKEVPEPKKNKHPSEIKRWLKKVSERKKEEDSDF